MSATTETEREVSSADLRAVTAGPFHPVRVERTVVVEERAFSSDDQLTPASTASDAGAVGAVVRHPNGDQEFIYEYANTVIGRGHPLLPSLAEGDTVWTADWGDVHKPVLTPPDRDYTLRETRSEAENTSSRRDRGDLAALVAAILGTAGLLVTGLSGLVAIETVSPTSGATALAALAFTYLVLTQHRFISSPHESSPAALGEDASEVTAPDSGGDDVLERVTRLAETVDDWETFCVSDVDVGAGEVDCAHTALEEEVTLQFATPRKWSDEYDMVALVEGFGVGSAEQLVDEEIELRYNHHTVNTDLVTADDRFAVRVPR